MGFFLEKQYEGLTQYNIIKVVKRLQWLPWHLSRLFSSEIMCIIERRRTHTHDHIIYQQGVGLTRGRESATFHRTTTVISVFHVVTGTPHTHAHTHIHTQREYNF